MDFRFGLGGQSDQGQFRVMALNVELEDCGEVLQEMIGSVQPDIVSLQGCHGKHDYPLPPAYRVIRHGDVVFGARHQIVTTPEEEYALGCPGTTFSVYDLALTAKQITIDREEPAFRETLDAESAKSGKVVPKGDSTNFTIDVRLPNENSGSPERRRFLFELGEHYFGTCAYVESNQLFVGVWRREVMRWHSHELPANAEGALRITAVYNKEAGNSDLYLNGRFVSSKKLPPEFWVGKADLTIGSFRGTSRCEGVQPRFPTPRFVVSVEGKQVEFVNIHNQSPRAALSTGNTVDFDKFLLLNAAIAGDIEVTDSVPAVVLGDFNMPVESQVYLRHWSKFGNAFSMVGRGYGYTKSHPSLNQLPFARLSHILFSQELRATKCWTSASICKEDLPLFAEFAFVE